MSASARKPNAIGECRIPNWLNGPLPVNATVNKKDLATLSKSAKDLPKNLNKITRLLNQHSGKSSYDPLAHKACEYVWLAIQQDKFRPANSTAAQRCALIWFANSHMNDRAQARVLRRLAKDPELSVRRTVEATVGGQLFNEVALPRTGPDSEWDKSGWQNGLIAEERPQRLTTDARKKLALPKLTSVRKLIKELGIKSEKQLGWLLTATANNNGPYTQFTIPKRSGAERTICAPKWQLRSVQQQILQKILYHIPVHKAAHGFVPGRSTVTNAQPHVGKALLLKFDLEDFFPTIHHYRVVGLFASLGYEYADGRFSNNSKSKQVAPTLARLCMFTENSKRFGGGFLPQGAPSSPAITNIICRKLDARLSGLAKQSGADYTRYADDLTFSFADDGVGIGRFRWWVDQICHQEGFLVNQSKFRAIRASQRQSVTGIVVNDCLRLPRKERRRFRAILHNCQQHGVESQARGNAGFRNWLRGYASYFNMVHPDEGRAILDEVNALLGNATDESQS